MIAEGKRKEKEYADVEKKLRESIRMEKEGWNEAKKRRDDDQRLISLTASPQTRDSHYHITTSMDEDRSIVFSPNSLKSKVARIKLNIYSSFTNSLIPLQACEAGIIISTRQAWIWINVSFSPPTTLLFLNLRISKSIQKTVSPIVLYYCRDQKQA